MKTTSIFITSLLLTINLLSQTPGINYQAVVRDADGLPLANQAVSLSIDILEADLLLFTETHELVTDEFGLVNTMIGNGVAEFGTLENLVGKKDLSYTLTGTINGTETSLGAGKLGAVPYAYYGADEDADPENELQDLSIVDNKLTISGSQDSIDLDEYLNYWDKVEGGVELDLDRIGSRNVGERVEIKRFIPTDGSFDLVGFGLLLVGAESQSVWTLSEEGGIPIKTEAYSDYKNRLAYEELTGGAENNISKNTIYKFDSESNLQLIKTQEYTKGANISWSSGLTNFSPNIPFSVQTSSVNVVDNEEDLIPNSLLIESNDVIDYEIVPLDNSEIEPFHKVEIIPGLFISSNLIKEDETIKNESRLSPDGAVVCSREEIYTADGLISSNCSSIDHTNCIEISDGGKFNSKVSQNGETAINQGIDGSLRFNEVNGNNGVSSAGNLVFNNEDGDPVAASAVASSGAGILNAAGAGGSPPLSRNGNMTAFPNTQHFTAGGVQLSMGINSDFAGNISVYNNGSPNLNLGTLQGIPDAGSIVGYDQGAPKWYLYTQDGVSKLLIDMIQSTVLSPNHNEDLAYGVLAGPEQAAYERGTATLVDGEVFVSCADHFAGIADPNSMTVTVTPLSAESLGLAIVEKSGQGFKVKELYKGKGNYSFDYMVMCKRSDVTYKLKPELPRADNSMKEISDQARMSYLKAKNAIK